MFSEGGDGEYVRAPGSAARHRRRGEVYGRAVRAEEGKRERQTERERVDCARDEWYEWRTGRQESMKVEVFRTVRRTTSAGIHTTHSAAVAADEESDGG